MKRALIGFCCLAAGFSLARLVPVSKGTALPASAGPESIKSGSTVVARPVAPVSFSVEGDWRPQAQAWAERNPAEFYQWLVERGIPPGEEVLMVLFNAWSRQDVDAAFTAAFNLPGDFQRDEVLDDVMAWALAAPGGLQAALKWIPQVEEQLSVWVPPGEEWMKSGPPQEITGVLAGLPKGEGFSDNLMAQFAAYWAKQDLPAVMAWLHGLGPAQKASAFRGLMKTWAKTDPRAALRYLEVEATSQERSNAYQPLAELAKTDPRAALDWWENNIGVADSNSLRQIFSQWNEGAAIEARDYALAIEDPALRRHTLEAWGETAKAAELFQALDQVPAGPDRRTLLRGLTQKYPVDQAGNETIRHLVADPGNSDVTPAMAASVSRYFAYDEPQAALNWTATLPAALQEESARAVVRVWTDQVAAAQAVENLPDGPMKAAALEAIKAGLMPNADPFR